MLCQLLVHVVATIQIQINSFERAQEGRREFDVLKRVTLYRYRQQSG